MIWMRMNRSRKHWINAVADGLNAIQQATQYYEKKTGFINFSEFLIPIPIPLSLYSSNVLYLYVMYSNEYVQNWMRKWPVKLYAKKGEQKQ